ncbi:MAG: dihydrolipoyllysine-residue acetyltransferase [Betaproteobacteria bacterium]|jgi:pyruvate dehydrogenase E2 component (dihydrolipoamide acetyltransferase)|nr:dihydrolipoyllysine-residue acetyltransferase [Betaproteobacteria bacterium]
MGAIREVLVPDIGDFKDVPVIEVLVKPGDAVKADDSLITLESDKATMEVPAPFAGVVKELRVKVGDRLSQGAAILALETVDGGAVVPASPAPPPPTPAAPAGEPAPAEAATAPAPAARPVPSAPEVPRLDEAAFAKAHASPAVRRLARELGVDLGKVPGSGPKSRILKEDVQSYVKGALSAGATVAAPATPGGGLAPGLPAWPVVDFAKFGPVETRPLTRIQKISGPALHRNWVMIPHVTQNDEADITDLEAFRKQISEEAVKQGVKVTPLALILKAVAATLKAFPEFNASLAPGGDALVVKNYYHLGVAVDTPEGLVVPVIRDVDQKGVIAIARELAEASQKARDRKLGPTDMQGGTFSVSSLGGIGGTHFTPIINAPEVAILGVSRSSMKPVWREGAFVPRLVLPLSLSYDHRVIDGAKGARFISHLNGVLSDIRRVLL